MESDSITTAIVAALGLTSIVVLGMGVKATSDCNEDLRFEREKIRAISSTTVAIGLLLWPILFQLVVGAKSLQDPYVAMVFAWPIVLIAFDLYHTGLRTKETESEEHAREVLAARFQGIAQPRDPSQVEVLPADTDVLCASVMSAELEGSWRESWSKDSAASKLKQVLRLMKASQRRGSGVPWVLIEASTALLESDGEGVPIVCDLVSEFERLGYRWAHRTVAAAAFGVPDIRPRVLLVGSKHGDPRDVLLAEDAGANGAAFEPPGADQAQAFVFNKRPDGTVRVFSDFVEGFHPREGSCVLTPSGALAPLELHDAERLQGLPPGWTLTARPPAPGMPPAAPGAGWQRRIEMVQEVVTDATHEANLICEKTLLNTAKRRGRAEAQAHPQKDRQDR